MTAVVLDPEGYRTLQPGDRVDVVWVGDRSVVVRARDGRNAVLLIDSVRLAAGPDRKTQPEERSE